MPLRDPSHSSRSTLPSHAHNNPYHRTLPPSTVRRTSSTASPRTRHRQDPRRRARAGNTDLPQTVRRTPSRTLARPTQSLQIWQETAASRPRGRVRNLNERPRKDKAKGKERRTTQQKHASCHSAPSALNTVPITGFLHCLHFGEKRFV